jgi:UDP-3-O-[3-hydroxymyristoyl] glucosamine N-acyltransferase
VSEPAAKTSGAKAPRSGAEPGPVGADAVVAPRGLALLSSLRVARLRLRGVRAGRGVRVGPGVRVARGAVVGDRVLLAAGCRVDGGVIGARARIGERAIVAGDVGADAVVGDWGVVGPGARVGERARIAAHAVLEPGARVRPGAVIASYAVVEANSA